MASETDNAILSAACKTVDKLLEAEGEESPADFLSRYKEQRGIYPTGDKERILRAVKVLDKYHLILWDTYQRHGNHNYVGYRFVRPDGLVLFQGTDYGVPQQEVIDGDDVVMGLLRWLVLKPGDTDDEYFEKYTPEQLEFAQSDDAEEIGMAVHGSVPGYDMPFKDLPGYEHGEEEE